MALIAQKIPFISQFVQELNDQLICMNGKVLSEGQREWLSFCLLGVLITESVCWKRFEQASVGHRTHASLSYMFRNSDIPWNSLLTAAASVLIKKYNLRSGYLVIDDSDRPRSKNTKKISGVHKIKCKNTGGFFKGQNLVFLALVTERITIPVGWKLYIPDPNIAAWKKEDKRLQKAGKKKKERPKEPEYDPKHPSKIGISITLLEEFKKQWPEFCVSGILMDAAYCSGANFNSISKVYPNSQAISFLKANQFARQKKDQKWETIENCFKNVPIKSEKIKIREITEKEIYFARKDLEIQTHSTKRPVIKMAYDPEKEFRYLTATCLGWQSKDLIRSYSYRWLVEVFFEDWKVYEGWKKYALQPGVEGSMRGVVLSLLVDLALLSHPMQNSRIETKDPLLTVGSLRNFIRNESMTSCILELMEDEAPYADAIANLKKALDEVYSFTQSKKHMSGSEFFGNEATALKGKIKDNKIRG